MPGGMRAARKSLSWRIRLGKDQAQRFQARSSPQAVVGGFNRFAHSAGPGIEGRVRQVCRKKGSSVRTPGQPNGGCSFPMPAGSGQ